MGDSIRPVEEPRDLGHCRLRRLRAGEAVGPRLLSCRTDERECFGGGERIDDAWAGSVGSVRVGGGQSGGREATITHRTRPTVTVRKSKWSVWCRFWLPLLSTT